MKTLLYPVLCLFFLPAFSQVNVDHPIVLTGSGTNARVEGVGRVQSYSDAASVDYIQKDSLTFGPDGGSANAYSVTLSPAPSYSSYPTGIVVSFKAAHSNTGGSTLIVNGHAADSILKNYSQPLAANDIQAGQVVTVVFDGGTHFQMLSQLGNSLNATTWGLTGNTGTNANNDFLGTIDSTDLVLRTDNTERARIKASGNLLVDNSIQLTGSGTNARVEGIGRVQSYSDAASVDYIQKDSLTFGPDGGSANAYSVTLSPTPSYSSYPTGMVVSFKAANSNTGGSTLTVNGHATDSILKNYSQPLAANDIQAGQIVTVMFDGGTHFQMLSQLGNSTYLSMTHMVIFSSSTTWVAPAGVTAAMFEAWGGGGGGGASGSASADLPANCGGGGGYGKGIFTVIPATTYYVSVGAGGSGGAASGGSGNGGGTSCVSTATGCTGTVYLSATGGGGGASSGSATGHGTGGTSSSPSGGSILSVPGQSGNGLVVYGMSGYNDFTFNGGAGGHGGGPGGINIFQSTNTTSTLYSTSLNGSSPGGGGACSAASTSAGGSGATGEVIIYY